MLRAAFARFDVVSRNDFAQEFFPTEIRMSKIVMMIIIIHDDDNDNDKDIYNNNKN